MAADCTSNEMHLNTASIVQCPDAEALMLEMDHLLCQLLL